MFASPAAFFEASEFERTPHGHSHIMAMAIAIAIAHNNSGLAHGTYLWDRLGRLSNTANSNGTTVDAWMATNDMVPRGGIFGRDA